MNTSTGAIKGSRSFSSSGDHYSPLQIPSHFRLIAIRNEEVANISAQQMKCNLVHFSLENENVTPLYHALSYEWGVASYDDPVIHINGMPHTIRKNLFEALKQLHSKSVGYPDRTNDRSHWIWIDALCINQEDLLEWNQQVTVMSRIYNSAEVVVIWLGISKDDSDMVMDILSEDHELRGINWFMDQQKGDALSVWLHRSYWNWIWIVQEIQRARFLEILCGNRIISWEQLINPKSLRHMG